MGITYIPGPGQEIAQSISGIGDALNKFMNPNRDLQIAVQRAAATNPELLQHMADMEAANPGTMARLGLGNVGQAIAGVSQSAAGAAEQAVRPGAPKQAVAQQQAATQTAETTTAKGALTAEVIQKAGKIMAADPSISFDAARQLITGQTAAQAQTETAKADVATAESKRQLEQLQRAGQLPKDLNTIDWNDQARKFLDGNLPGALPTAYFGNPDTAKSFQEAISSIMQQRQIDASKAIAAMRRSDSVDDFRVQKAFQEYQRSGGVGNLDVWQKFLFDPGAQARAKDLISGKVKPETPEDKDLLNIANVTKQQVDLDKIRDVTLINDKINNQIKKVNEAGSDEERQVLLDGLNQYLGQRTALGGMAITAKYNDRGLWLPGRVEYHDASGKLIDSSVVNAVLADPLGTDIKRTESAQKPSKVVSGALDLIAKPGVDVVGAMAAFRLQDKSPSKADSRALEDSLVSRGLLKRVGGGTAKP